MTICFSFNNLKKIKLVTASARSDPVWYWTWFGFTEPPQKMGLCAVLWKTKNTFTASIGIKTTSGGFRCDNTIPQSSHQWSQQSHPIKPKSSISYYTGLSEQIWLFCKSIKHKTNISGTSQSLSGPWTPLYTSVSLSVPQLKLWPWTGQWSKHSNRSPTERLKKKSAAELRELCMDKCCTCQWTEATLWRRVDQKSSTIMQQTHRATLYFYFRLLVLKQVLWAQLFTARQTYRLLYLDLCVLLKGQQEEKNEC